MTVKKFEGRQQTLGVAVDKNEDFSDWFTQVCLKAELIDLYSIKGCYIMRPASVFIWNEIRRFIDSKIIEMGVQEVYFPMLIQKENLEKEKSHIESFEPEVAWVTHSGSHEIAPLAIRPTSEAIMYPYFKKWIKSHRDLPLKVNQWCNILRWEIKSTVPFIRGREFLWQEGHCVYATKEECDKEVKSVLNLYEEVYNKLLAVPVIKGIKTENEKFGGADYTLTVEAFIKGSGRAVQAATSHSLGTNFSKMFDIDVDFFPFQSSWGLTTRTIGVALMTHSDQIGAVLPPRVANIQVVMIPCGKTNNDVQDYIFEMKLLLTKSGFRVHVDSREKITPGFKFNHWEVRGIPIRIEVGPRDFKDKTFVMCLRHSQKKDTYKFENIVEQIADNLSRIHNEMFAKAEESLKKSIKEVGTWSEFIKEINNKNICLISWCGEGTCEDDIKEESKIFDDKGNVQTMGAKSLCLPFNLQENIGNCVKCDKRGLHKALFGRSY